MQATAAFNEQTVENYQCTSLSWNSNYTNYDKNKLYLLAIVKRHLLFQY